MTLTLPASRLTATRATRSGRGGRPWRRLRERVLQRDGYLCQPCRRAGRVTEAAEVDHIIPLARGGTDAPENLQAICVPCHRAKTLADEPQAGAATIPDWLRPPLVPVTVVAGPAGAGKSTYVAERAAASDLVLDFDSIAAELSGLPRYAAGPEWIAPTLRTRNARLASLADAPVRYTAAWLIVSAPTASERARWRTLLTTADGQPARVVVLAVEPETCRRRTLTRPAPAGGASGETWEVITGRWWARYSGGRDEEVVRG